ncbi:calcium-binding protein [Falsiroseomonas selenitidurans]|uniref:Calcium-binding protein n=1 Tax=Falsiroseomonas selenitidurans TaxID=2716335 RepID=A0ABX1E1H1_9PROT|nr:calcium-binding protein [Falsiroseomonas selenitidurans]NKC30933.1 calcium-binding protein [Falsiroseomonas selenitidurans]
MSSSKPQPLTNETLESVTGGFNERSGGAGADTIVGGDGADKLMGSNTWAPGSDGNWQPTNSGNDVLVGGGGGDELHGGDGDDHLRGGTGDDKVFGGDGADTIWWRAGDGNDELHGGPGSDNVMVEGVSLQQVTAGLQLYQGSYSVVGNSIVFNGPANGQFTVNGETVRFFGVEQLTMPDSTSTPPVTPPVTPPSSGGDVINGTSGSDNLAGSGTWGMGSDGSWQPQSSGNDQFNAGAGNDEAHGGDGDDSFRMGTGDDKAFGGDGNDVFYWSPGNGQDEFHGGPGQDSMIIEGTPFSSISSSNMMMYDGGSYRFEGNSIVFNGPSNGQITINGQVVKFFGMERINFTNS